MAETFRNWSGSVEFTPSSRTRPSDVDDIVDLVNDARTHSRILRPVGSAHSSQPLFDTPDTLIHLDHLSGVKDVDRDNGLATVLPGTGLSDMDNQLDEHGWALSNLGDVDYQTIAGAIGTGHSRVGRHTRQPLVVSGRRAVDQWAWRGSRLRHGRRTRQGPRPAESGAGVIGQPRRHDVADPAGGGIL